MWIRRLHVTDCAGIADASIDLEFGLNVLHGPNELGKSSLVSAVRAALLLQSSSSAAEPLRDWHADAAPVVELTFEEEAQRVWRVRKSFASSGGYAYLDFSRDGSEFTQDGRGGEVDGKLRDLLRWGVEAPGGRRGRRGMPESFITTALLGEQSDVVAILGSSLDKDPDGSGRERLTEALQAMAEDPRFKRVHAAVQQKVDEAFTATGRRRSGRASPWSQIREQRVAAEANERNVHQQMEESEGARLRIEELHRELLAAESEKERTAGVLANSQAALEQRRKRAATTDSLADAQAEFDRIQGLFAKRDGNVDAINTAREKVAKRESACGEAETAAEALAPRVEAARQGVRRLETGAGEQQRRLREEEAKNRLLKLRHEEEALERDIARAEALATLDEEVTALAADIEKREAALNENRDLLRQAQDVTDSDQEEIVSLEIKRRCARYLVALDAARASAKKLDTAREHIGQATVLERKAAEAHEEASNLGAPVVAELDRLRSLETDRRIAQERLAVGLVVGVELKQAGDAEVNIDGQPRQVRIGLGKQAKFEAERELRLDLAGIGAIHVRGGGRDLLRAAEAAEDSWNAVATPIFTRTGCASLGELEDLRERADGYRETAVDLERGAEQERVRAEGVDEFERGVVVAKAEEEQRRSALAELLEEDESVEEYLESLDEPPDDELALEEAIEKRRTVMQDREELCQRMESKVTDGEGEVVRRGRELAGKRALLREGSEMDDWRAFLAGVDAERDRLSRRLEAVDDELALIGAEGAAEVGEARQALNDLAGEENRAQEALRVETEQLANARDELSRLEGEAAGLRAATENEDLEAAGRLRDQHRDKLDALPIPIDDIDPAELQDVESAATATADCFRQLEMQLRNAEGALEQVGGQYILERAEQAGQALRALAERESELDLEYRAWRLLHETLVQAEKEDAVHLGNALVKPVSERMAALTGGRYGEIAIGPQLEAAGIQSAGCERKFEALSVGTLEQIALLLRLSIAEALDSFIVFDDQLTQSDPVRMVWMRELLERAAEQIQVVVLTCHPEDYTVGDGQRHVVDLSSCIRRREVSNAQVDDGEDGLGSEAPHDSAGEVDSSNADPAEQADPSPTRRTRHRRSRRHGTHGDDDVSAALRSSLGEGSSIHEKGE